MITVQTQLRAVDSDLLMRCPAIEYSATVCLSWASSGIQTKRCNEVTIGSYKSFVGVLDRPK